MGMKIQKDFFQRERETDEEQKFNGKYDAE